MIERISQRLLTQVNRRKHDGGRHGKEKTILLTVHDYNEIILDFVNNKDSICVHCGGVVDLAIRGGECNTSTDRILSGDSPYEKSNVRLVHNCCNEYERYSRNWNVNKENFIKRMESLGEIYLNPTSSDGKKITEQNKSFILADKKTQLMMEQETKFNRSLKEHKQSPNDVPMPVKKFDKTGPRKFRSMVYKSFINTIPKDSMFTRIDVFNYCKNTIECKDYTDAQLSKRIRSYLFNFMKSKNKTCVETETKGTFKRL